MHLEDWLSGRHRPLRSQHVGALAVDFAKLSNISGRNLEFSRSLAIGRSGSLDWIDPLVGLRLRHQFTPQQEIWVRGDFGGFGFQSNF